MGQYIESIMIYCRYRYYQYCIRATLKVSVFQDIHIVSVTTKVSVMSHAYLDCLTLIERQTITPAKSSISFCNVIPRYISTSLKWKFC